MNAIEMIYEFEQYLGTLDMTIQKPKTSDTLHFINIAQHDMHTEHYQSLEVNEESRKIMAPFIVLDEEIDVFVVFNGSIPNAKRVTLPAALQYTTREVLEVNVDQYGRIGAGLGPRNHRVVPITMDEYERNKLNPNRKPYYDESWRMDASEFAGTPTTDKEHLIIHAEGITPTKYWVSYVKEISPLTEDVSSVSEFPEWYHDQVVKQAVALYANVRNPGSDESDKGKKED